MTNEELLQKLRQCGHYLHRMPEGRMSQRRILGILNEREGMTQRELQAQLDIRSASMSEILGKIEGEGLIERTPSPEDRRNMLVRLSEEGRTVATALSQAYNRQTGELFACLDEAEKDQLGGYLDRLQRHWQEKFAAREADDEFPGPHPFGPGPHRPGPFGPGGHEGPGGPHRPGPGGRHGPRGFGEPGEGGPHGDPEEGGGFGPRGFRGAPGRHGTRPEQVLPGRNPDRPEPEAFRTLPGERAGDSPLTTLPGGKELCNHDCANCSLREEGRCVRRVQRRV